jgi:hypothetical protein
MTLNGTRKPAPSWPAAPSRACATWKPKKPRALAGTSAGSILVLDNGTTLIVQADDEGNAPGAVWYDAKGVQGLFPTL